MKYIEVLEDEVIVKTPRPYEISRKGRVDLESIEENWIYKMEQSVKFLYDVLRLLKIPLVEAKARGYTLNIHTGEDLLRIASQKEISAKMWEVIRDFNW